LRGIRWSYLHGTRGEAEGAGGAPDSKPDKSMNSRVSWSSEGIDPSVRERAEAAARRAGMSLSDWLNSTLGDTSPPNFRAPPERPVLQSQETQDVADIHQRLDSITRQIEQISRPAPRNDAPRSDAVGGESGVARQLNEAISRLDARLSQISNPAPVRQVQPQDAPRKADRVERVAPPVYRPSPPLSPASLDFAIAEIAARQSELDRAAPQPAPRRSALPPAPVTPPPAPVMAPPPAPVMAPEMAPPLAPPAAPGPDFSSLERHLIKITSQIEALQRPDEIEQSIAAFRGELMEIRQAITEAMPRRAIESIEEEIRSLSRRIDDTRQSGIDAQALAGIEHALGEIREVLRSLTTAEQLSGYDEAIRNLGTKLDLILRANDDPSTVQQLEGAISALRNIVANVASNDTLVRLNDDVQTLAAKVDQLNRQESSSDSFALLEQRIAALTSALENRERPPVSDGAEQLEGVVRALSDRLDRIPAGNDNASAFAHLETALQTLSERFDRMPVGNDSESAFAHLEQRVTYLLERLEASAEHRAGNLGRVEEGLQDILRHLETQHATVASLAENSRSMPEPADSGLIDIVKRELSDIRFSQSANDRQTQDSLETVHNTLGHVVDRLAMIEGDLRAARAQPVAPPPVAPQPVAPPAPQPAPAPAASPAAAAPRVVMAPQPKPELPNPAAAKEHFVPAPREFQAAPPAMPVAGPVAARAISEILEPYTSQARPAVMPELPPDHPLEPGTRPAARLASPSERIAASENAISEIPAAAPEKVSTSSFIAAARRAAQAAQAASQAGDKKAGGPLKQPGAGQAKKPSTISAKIRSLLVGASVVVIVLGTFKIAMMLLDGGSALPVPVAENSGPSQPLAPPPADDSAKPAMTRQAVPDPVTPSMTSPTPIGQQSLNGAAPNTSASPAPAANPPLPATPSTSPAGDNTGSIAPASTAPRTITWAQIPPNEKLPDAIGGPVLRAAALKGDPAAAYEVGLRFAEGKGVAANYDEAAKWYGRAAHAGVVPAIFRIGTFYEKGLSVKKDVDVARRYYLQAAERGNAKAMHNLAVLDADGGGKGANYKSAAQWFRKAADRGVADSQFNLGILYARGIGVEQNLAESFKWFSLAAAQGDADAGRKRDDIAKRLDSQSLAAAKLAIQTFTPEPQPDDAINVASPAGGWDSAPAQVGATKPLPKHPQTRRTAAR
jgi:localization factor PodJL